MCGIAGVLRSDGAPVEHGRLNAMARALAHRGPDDSGIWTDGPIALVNTRLAVLGLGTQGHQPMSDASGRVWITYNGEIYNFRELRSELMTTEPIRTDTDTEVVLAAYMRWGLPAALERLNGIFAFAIWDMRDHTLHLSRDRLGVKPLFVDRGEREIVFASELNAIATTRQLPPIVDRAALDAYLAVGYVPGPRSIWRSVSSIVPGSAVSWEDGVELSRRYWSLRPRTDIAPRSYQEAVERTRAAVETAVKRQLVSDVPLGVFLSGGIDSSIVTAVAARERPRLCALTVRFGERGFDETAEARHVAAHLGVRHEVADVSPDLWSTLPALIEAYGQPFADASALAVSAVSAAARRSMTVALSGDGGDEVFAGYPTYLANDLARIYRRSPQILRAFVEAAAARMPVTHAKVGLTERLQRFAAAAAEDAFTAHARWREHFSLLARQELLRPAGTVSASPAELFEETAGAARAFAGDDRFLAFDVLSYLPSDILAKVDGASMLHSLEVRVPLLDHELVELAFSIPHGMKRNAFRGKRVLRSAFAELLPRDAMGGGKRGFNVPIARWLAGPLYDRAREVFHDSGAIGDLVDTRVAPRLLEEHRRRQADHSVKLWTLLVLYLWYEGTRARVASWPGPINSV